jgi:purine-binding chemotaxis protein CheW
MSPARQGQPNYGLRGRGYGPGDWRAREQDSCGGGGFDYAGAWKIACFWSDFILLAGFLMSNPKANESVTDKFVRKVAQFVTFRVDGQAYAFRIDQIREIVILNQVTRIPQVPDYVEGVANLRGSIIPIINLRTLFGLPTKSLDSDTRTIVVHVGEKLVGCQVDSVTQVVRIDHDSIRPAPDTVTGNGAGYIAGFARVQEQLVVLLDINQLLDPQRLDQVGRLPVPDAAHPNN